MARPCDLAEYVVVDGITVVKRTTLREHDCPLRTDIDITTVFRDANIRGILVAGVTAQLDRGENDTEQLVDVIHRGVGTTFVPSDFKTDDLVAWGTAPARTRVWSTIVQVVTFVDTPLDARRLAPSPHDSRTRPSPRHVASAGASINEVSA